jgi:hypothetical protein
VTVATSPDGSMTTRACILTAVGAFGVRVSKAGCQHCDLISGAVAAMTRCMSSTARGTFAECSLSTAAGVTSAGMATGSGDVGCSQGGLPAEAQAVGNPNIAKVTAR